MRRLRLSITLGLAAAAATVALASLPVRAAPRSLTERLRAAVAPSEHRSLHWSAAVWDTESGDRLYASSPDTLRRTASVMKLATTGAALLELGPDHELFLEVRGETAPDDGVLRGDLRVEGTGDPGLSAHLTEGGADAALATLARAVRDAGVRRVTGDLVLDTSAFPGPARHPGWDRKPWQYDWYMAPVTALTINDACVDLTATPGASVGAPAVISLAPRGVRVPFVNELTTTSDKSEHLVALRAPEDDGRIRVTGEVWTGSSGYVASVACAEPPEMLRDAFAQALADAGVEIAGERRVVRGPPAAGWPRPEGRPGVVLARHASRLADVMRVCNRRSQNLYAELILRNLGLHAGGDASFEGGCRAVRRILELGDDFEQEDGSGLSRGNRATVGAIGGILLRLYGSEHRIEFMTSLAIGGDPEGTLRKRFREERFAGRVLAKTGTLRDTKTLAGFVRGDSGRVFAFAILCEGAPGRASRLQDAVVGVLVGE